MMTITGEINATTAANVHSSLRFSKIQFSEDSVLSLTSQSLCISFSIHHHNLYFIEQVNLDVTLSICMPPPVVQRTDGRKLVAIPQPEKYLWSRYDLDL